MKAIYSQHIRQSFERKNSGRMLSIPGCTGLDHRFRKYTGDSIKFNFRGNHDSEYGEGERENKGGFGLLKLLT